MGWWKTERGFGGDSWADEMGRCTKALSEQRMPKKENNGGVEESGEITIQAFADLVEFCSRGHLEVNVKFPDKDGGRPLSELGNWGVETYPNKGQMHS